MGNIRYVEVWSDKFNDWVILAFNGIKKDMIFKIFEPDGALVTDEFDNNIFRAVSDAYLNEEDIYTVDLEPVQEGEHQALL